MKRIIEYDLAISEDGKVDFVKRVNDKIAKGFQPFGSVSVIKRGGSSEQYTQALVKYEGETK